MNRQDRRRRARLDARHVTKLQEYAAANPHSAAGIVQASQQLFQLGRVAEALPLLTRAIAEYPEAMAIRGMLAYALASTGKVAAAISQYREMLRRDPGSAPLRTNLAVLLLRSGASDEARELLLEASRLAPEHANTAYTLGELFDQQKRRDQAFHHYRRAAVLSAQQIGPRPGAAQCNDLVKLASAQMWTGDIKGALTTFERAVALRPDHALALARRGLLLAKLRRMPEAVASLKRAAAAEPGYAEVRRALGDLLLNEGQTQTAKSHYRAALRLNPADAVAEYFLAAASSETPDAPPPSYVVGLFDDYAERFEQHLVDVLQYRAPELLTETIRQIARPPAAAWNVIDLGCGTGLCGPLIRPCAHRLTGVDLSAAMLEKAREKAVYDELIRGDVNEVFGGYSGTIDLALSADVFIYLGSLTPVFDAASRAVRPAGWFAFTTEAHDGTGFVLDATGRYAHSRGYVQSEATAHGLEIVHVESIVARYQSRQPVLSDLFMFRRRR